MGVVGRVMASDAALARWLNALVRRSGMLGAMAAGAASWLAGVEVALMGALFFVGGRGSAGRMLAAVTLVYAASEVLGRVWRRRRPFSELSDVEGLVPHSAQRSFPSRHVASGLEMAVVGRRAHSLGGL